MIHTLTVLPDTPPDRDPYHDIRSRYHDDSDDPDGDDSDDSPYTYYDGLGMIAHAGTLFILVDPDRFHELHKASSTYYDISLSKVHNVWDGCREDNIEFIQIDSPSDYTMFHHACASEETTCWSPSVRCKRLTHNPLTMPALQCIQGFILQRLHVLRLAAQRKFTAFLIYGSRQTDTLQRVDDDVLKIIMKLAGP